MSLSAWRLCGSVFLNSVLVMAAAAGPLLAQEPGPAVLLVTAHPDDEAMFAATVYRLTRELGGAVDLAVITDGSGGYRYSHLAEPLYGLELTDERVARQHLPAIRKRELMAAGEILGLRNYFFMDAFDHEFTTNADTVLQHVWDADLIRERLRDIMTRGEYDFVFVHLPTANFHGHHKAATVLALEAARVLGPSQRPVVLGCFMGSKSDTAAFEYSELEGHPITRIRRDVPPFIFDRTQPADDTGKLTYQIIVNWEIAEHRSQGTMQLLMNMADLERFWVFEANPAGAVEETKQLFKRLAVSRQQ